MCSFFVDSLGCGRIDRFSSHGFHAHWRRAAHRTARGTRGAPEPPSCIVWTPFRYCPCATQHSQDPICWIRGAKNRMQYSIHIYNLLNCFMNTLTLNMYVSMAYTGYTMRNTLFIFVWLRPRNTWIPIQHVCPRRLCTWPARCALNPTPVSYDPPPPGEPEQHRINVPCSS